VEESGGEGAGPAANGKGKAGGSLMGKIGGFKSMLPAKSKK